jgi:hypothetical protein
MISGWLPDAREKVELLAKQSVFRGMSQILGTSCDMEHYAAVLYPNALDPHRADQLWLAVTRGFRRVRPGLLVKYETVYSTTPMQTVAGDPVEGPQGLLLEPFCSKPLPNMRATHLGNRAEFAISVEGVGPQSAVNLAHAIVLLGKKELHRMASEPVRKTAISVGVTMPSRSFIFDLLLHEDVYPGQQPTLHLYRTGVRGVADPNDRSFDIDQLEIIESIQPLGRGIAGLRATENPEYLEMLRHVLSLRHWDHRRLRGYRCRIEFPIYHSQVMFGLDLPAGPP